MPSSGCARPGTGFPNGLPLAVHGVSSTCSHLSSRFTFPLSAAVTKYAVPARIATLTGVLTGSPFRRNVVNNPVRDRPHWFNPVSCTPLVIIQG